MSKLAIVTSLIGWLIGGTALSSAHAQPSRPIPIVAAENFYGDIAKPDRRRNVAVTSILTNPDQDPHLFEASASVARSISAARLVIYNGVDYDPWVAKLLAAPRKSSRTTLDGRRSRREEAGRQPTYLVRPGERCWLSARALAGQLAIVDPAACGRLPSSAWRRSKHSLQPIQAKIAALRTRLAGTARHRDGAGVRLHVRRARHDRAQCRVPARGDEQHRAVVPPTSPPSSDLKTHQVKLLVYNSQAADPVAARMARPCQEQRTFP